MVVNIYVFSNTYIYTPFHPPSSPPALSMEPVGTLEPTISHPAPALPSSKMAWNRRNRWYHIVFIELFWFQTWNRLGTSPWNLGTGIPP